jgi:crossover junction endodeoxyribonuclease RuvC
MRVIGIDPGTARTGWGVVELNNGQLKPIDFGYVKTTTAQSNAERLKKIYYDLLAVINDLTPDVMAIEMIFFNTNVKSIITGNGRAKKSEVATSVMEELKLEEMPKPDDVTDALAIAATHIILNSDLQQIQH